MDSPFVAVAADVGRALAAVDPERQVLFYAASAEALLRGADGVRGTAVVMRAIDAAAGVADGATPTDETAQRLREVNAATPHGDDGEPQHAWICSSIALELAMGRAAVPAHAGVWYVLENSFQGASRRLFGVDDVGSDDEQVGEAAALEERGLKEAVAAVRSVIADLGPDCPEPPRRAVIVSRLHSLDPPQ